MVRMEKEMAVIGAVNELLRQHKESIVLNASIIFEYTRMMEVRSGYAVVNGFSAQSLEDFFSSHEGLFWYDLYESGKRSQPSFRLKINNFGIPRKMEDIKAFVGRMLDALDPAVNYPYGFLEDMQLLDILSGQ